MGKIRIVIADDHAVVRQGTRSLLEREKDLEVVGEAADGEEAVKLIDQLKPDVAIVDIAMPKLNGVEVTRQIKPRCPSTAVLILSAYDDDEYIFALLEAGAAGYLLKDVDSREVVEAVRAVHAGESVLHPVIARKLISRLVSPPAKAGEEKPTVELSEREMEVLKLAAKGMSNQDIAKELFISMRTVQAVRLRRISDVLEQGEHPHFIHDFSPPNRPQDITWESEPGEQGTGQSHRKLEESEPLFAEIQVPVL